jgi:GDPmannose 4,6-dehydratase
VIHAGSLESYPGIFNVVRKVEPEECYHLAAQSYVAYSFSDEFSILITNINGTHHGVEYNRAAGMDSKTPNREITCAG